MTERNDDLRNYCFLYGTTVERTVEKGESAKALTLTCKYFESPEDMTNPPKEIGLWTYRDDAIALPGKPELRAPYKFGVRIGRELPVSKRWPKFSVHFDL